LDKSGNSNAFFNPASKRLLADIVPVFEYGRPSMRHGDHGLHVRENASTGLLQILFRIRAAKGIGLFLQMALDPLDEALEIVEQAKLDRVLAA